MTIKYTETPKVLSFANYKGGVAKTTTTALISVELAKKGYRVLDIDLDPQATLTTLLAKTADLTNNGVFTVEKTLMQIIQKDEPLTDGVVNIFTQDAEDINAGRLDMIPSTADFSNYGYYLYSHNLNVEQRFKFLKDRIDPIKDKYDFILLDVSPALDTANWSAYYACDYIVIPMKTDEFTFNGTKVFIDAIANTLVDNDSREVASDVDILGILPTIVDPHSDLDKRVLKNAKKEFGDSVFTTNIPKMKRIQRYGVTGITDDDKDQWDMKVQEKIRSVVDELIIRLQVEDKS